LNTQPEISVLKSRHDAEHLTQSYDALLADARQLAANISMGAHGRRRSGMGEEFWQYRTAVDADALRDIDWRQSARSDNHFVRQLEWQNTQAVHLWVDRGASMLFHSQEALPIKAYRAAVLALSVSILLAKAGERVGWMDIADPPKNGMAQVGIIAEALSHLSPDLEFGNPARKQMKQGQKAVFISDFLGDWDEIFDNLSYAANQNVDGYLVQVLDPVEQEFPFKGRTVLFSMNEAHKFETLRAQSLRDEYLEKLAERKAALQKLSRKTGWRYTTHQTNEPASTPLMWLYHALEGSA
jgi:MoxR-like ATPase